MSILNIEKCPLCGKTDFRKVMTCVDHYATGESFDLCRCVSCGFMFTQHFPSEDEIGRYYESPDYISHSDTREGLMNNIYHIVRRHMLRKKQELISKYSNIAKGSLLDIGTGTGYFAQYMCEQGWNVTAIEKSPKARAFAQTNFGLDVFPPDVLSTLSDQTFHVITLWHVMEHLEHLNDTWDNLHRIIKDDGLLVIAVPNHLSADAQIYADMWAAYDVPRHLWHFSPSTMQQFGLKHGFDLMQTLPMPFDAFYVSMLSERYMKHSLAFLRGLLSGTRAWFRAFGNKERSSSIIYIFRKQ